MLRPRWGNRVNFGQGNCYTQNLATGAKTWIEEKGGTLEIGIWVPKSGLASAGANAIETKNKFSELSEECEESDLARLDEYL